MTSPPETKPSTNFSASPRAKQAQPVWSSDTAILIYVALATILTQLLCGGRFGFHRDELATLEDARHLAWGYVAYPPITPFFGRLSLILFGTSVSGFRFFAAVAQAASVVLTGLMARELGGRRGAQLVAAAAAIPFCLVSGALMQYVAFDYLCWVLTAYFVIRLLKSENPRWWLAIGAAIGLGMMAKYTMGFSLSVSPPASFSPGRAAISPVNGSGWALSSLYSFFCPICSGKRTIISSRLIFCIPFMSAMFASDAPRAFFLTS